MTDRLTDDEIKALRELRRAEFVIIDERCPPIDPETLAKAVARLAKFSERKDGGA